MQYVRAGVTEGLSARAAYRNMQADAARLSDETGLRYTGIRLYTFQQMYAGTRQARENVQEAINAPKDEPGGGLSIPERPSVVATGFLHAAAAFTRPTGASEVERTIHLVRSNEVLTPAQVEDLVREQIEQSATESHGTFAHYTVEGITFTGVQRLIQTRNR